MNIASTKERLIQYIDYKGDSKTIFFQKTGIKRGFLDSDKLDQAVSDKQIAMIIAVYEEINTEWLITGEGCMLKNSIDFKENSPLGEVWKEKYYQLLEKYNGCLEEKNRMYKENN
jgi:hypothetical protein